MDASSARSASATGRFSKKFSNSSLPGNQSITNTFTSILSNITTGPAGAGSGPGSGNGSAAGSTNTLPTSNGPAPSPYEREDNQHVWIQHQMKSREFEFTEVEKDEILVTTWNVNNKRPNPSAPTDLSAWFNFEGSPAIVAIGLQEMDMSAEALLLQEMASRSEPWEQAFNQHLQKKGKYHHLVTRQLCGILLCIYVRDDCKIHITEVCASVCTTGIMGIMGNKGAVGARLKFHDSTFCFITSHFNAFQNNVERRNQDFNDIVKGLKFDASSPVYLINTGGGTGGGGTTGTSAPSATPVAPGTSGAAGGSGPVSSFSDPFHEIGIMDHDNVFWLGDLNYRIDLEDAEVRKKIEEKKWDELVAADQLRQQILARKVFAGWSEGALNFAPTYKYDSGCDRYDTSEKHRIPAWTDRILWNSRYTELVSYGRHEITLSDHRPVTAYFRISIKKVIAPKRDKVLKELTRQLDNMINEGRPEAVLSTTSCHFTEPIPYAKEVRFPIFIENVGKVTAAWEFKPKYDSTIITKPWLTPTPMKGFLEAGTKEKIEFVVYIDKAKAPRICSFQEKVREIVVLGLKNGPDFFIDVKGKYLKSCFGNSLSTLCQYPRPIRKSEPLPNKLLPVPKELMRILDWLANHSVDLKGLFQMTAREEEIHALRECLDTGTDFPTTDFSKYTSAMSILLLKFLESFPEPVISYSCLPEILSTNDSTFHSRRVLMKLPAVNYNVFNYIIAFMKLLLVHQHLNGLNIDTLVSKFAPVLIWRPPDMNRVNISDEDFNYKRFYLVKRLLTAL